MRFEITTQTLLPGGFIGILKIYLANDVTNRLINS